MYVRIPVYTESRIHDLMHLVELNFLTMNELDRQTAYSAIIDILRELLIANQKPSSWDDNIFGE
jgi:hypothetical protein